MKWPDRGVCFFFQAGELRTTSGSGLRVVHVGANAIRSNTRANIWKRLSQHLGSSKGGNHRGSVFRNLVGNALIARNGLNCGTWDEIGNLTKRDEIEDERMIEQAVSQEIRRMLVLVIPVQHFVDEIHMRKYIKQNSVALLSNFRCPQIDPPSKTWLGRYSSHENVVQSGLWNREGVKEAYDIDFLDAFENFLEQ